MELKDYQKLAKPNGKVIMTILKDITPYRVGKQAGFDPVDAMFYHKEGMAYPIGGPVEYPVAPPAPAVAAAPEIEIPDGWRSMNRLALAKIAFAITGETPTPAITTQRCVDVIEAELARREGQAAPAPAAVKQPFPAVRAGSFPS